MVASPLSKDTSTEITLNDGVVSMNTEAAVSKEADQKMLKAPYLDEVSMLEEGEKQQQSVRSSNLKRKLVDIDSTLFHDSDMNKVDLSSIISEDDAAIGDEIQSAQSSRGVQLSASEEERGILEGKNDEHEQLYGDENNLNNDKKTATPYYRPNTPSKNRASTKKNTNDDKLDEEDEKMINDILAKSHMLNPSGENTNTNRPNNDALKRAETHTSVADKQEEEDKNALASKKEKLQNENEAVKKNKGSKCRTKGKNRKICPEFEAAPTVKFPVQLKTTRKAGENKVLPNVAQKERADTHRLVDNNREREAPSVDEKRIASEQEKALEMKLKAKGRAVSGKTYSVAGSNNKNNVKGRSHQDSHSKFSSKPGANTRDSHTQSKTKESLFHGRTTGQSTDDITRKFGFITDLYAFWKNLFWSCCFFQLFVGGISFIDGCQNVINFFGRIVIKSE